MIYQSYKYFIFAFYLFIFFPFIKISHWSGLRDTFACSLD